MSGDGESVTILQMLSPVARRLPIVVLVSGVSAAAVLAWAWLRPERFDATVVLAPVSAQAGGLNLGGAAALLAGRSGPSGAPTGLQVSPALVSDLLGSRRVLFEVGTSADADGVRVVDLIRGRDVSDAEVVSQMQKVVRSSVNDETGFIYLTVVQRDSALARLVAQRLVTAVAAAYGQISKAQASELRRAQDLRVDSARRTVEALDRALARLAGSNRITAEFSESSLERARVGREQQIAEQVYSRAVSDREAAVAKELEVTPVVVTVDSLPRVLPAVPRRAALSFVLVFVGVFVLSTLAVAALSTPIET